MDISRSFIALALDCGVLRFGEFITKAGRVSPYFFNAGLFNDGRSFNALCDFYAQTLIESDLHYDMLFGPAYKGIPLVAGVAMRLAERGENRPWAFNRKEAKDHGEKGLIVGAPLTGRVLILDDVISAGTSVRESVDLIRLAGAEPAGVLIALDRMEQGQGALSAVDEVRQDIGIPVLAVAKLTDLIAHLHSDPALACQLDAVNAYRERYGVSPPLQP